MKLDFKDLLRQLKGNEATHFVQFCKYGVVGVIATVINTTLIFFAAWKFWPALTAADGFLVDMFGVELVELTIGERRINYMYCSLFSFMISNAACYVMNVLWVFVPGRHSRAVEIGLFYAASGVAVGIGTGTCMWLVKFGWSTTALVGVNIVISVTINYVMRKFTVFKA